MGEQKDAQRPSQADHLSIASPQTKDRPSHQEIELIAYEIYLERGGIDGNALEDWLQAERRLLEAFESDSEKSEKTRARGA